MSNAVHQASLGADMTAGEFRIDRTPIADRVFAATYLTTVGVATIGWLYVISRAALAGISWTIFG